ncbi:MAG TPA: phosphatase PAP2 family protein [Ignavibacteria bacterium]|nr:phosphatase PAP2 family protein [Ignavibacteria bacterium]HMR41709.1 phosphatase PAP2 family protein [Ignavibacteria bacterium]
MYTGICIQERLTNSFRTYLSLFILFFSILNFNNVFSQGSHKAKTSIGQDLGSDAKIFLDDGISYYTLPFRFSGKDWLFTLAGAGAIGGLMTIDDNVKNAVVSDNDTETSRSWTVGKEYGNILFTGTGSVLIYTAGLLTHNKKIRVTGRMLIQSLLYSGIANSGIKYITGRSRPYVTNDQYQFNWFQTNNDYISFPSGHTTVAFAVSSVFAERIDTWWSRVFFYTLAAVTGYSRIHDNQHWLTDVVMGGVIGFSSGYFTVHREIDRDKKKSSVADKMNFNLSLKGLDFEYNF